MIRELVDVFRHDEVHSLSTTVDIADFKNLRVIAQNIRGHLEWRNVDDVNVGVFGSEDATDLRIFSLQKFVHRDALRLFYRKRVDMDLDPLPSFDCSPLLSEFFHHLFPNEEGLICKLVDTFLGLFLELVESETALDCRSFGH